MWAVLGSRSFATLFAGYTVSAIGDGMAAVAISWLAIVLAHGHDTGLLVGAPSRPTPSPGSWPGSVWVVSSHAGTLGC